MEKGSRGKFPIHDDVGRETDAQPFDSPTQQALPGGIFAEGTAHSQCATCRGAHQPFHGKERAGAKHLAYQQRPEQSFGGNLGLPPTVSRIPQIALESKTPRHKVQQTTWRRTVHFFFFLGFLRCWRSSTRSCALAANTSRTAS